MMKGFFHSKAKTAALAVAITLALTGSAMAMPVLEKNQTEGTVTISGLDTSSGTVNVAGVGLVDWKSFNLANGETLTFKLDSAADSNIINRVVGGDMSKIYGHMISEGEGGVFLVNPAGILIGNGAVIDVGSLILSAANITGDNANDILRTLEQGGDVTLQTTPDAVLRLEGDAKINFYDTLLLHGGKVQIADNVVISDGLKRAGVDTESGNVPDDATLAIVAANQANMEVTPRMEDGKLDGVDTGAWNVTTTEGNDVSISKASITAGDAEILGNAMTLDGVTSLSAGDHVDLFAGTAIGHANDEYQLDATAANGITVKDTTVDSGDPMIYGGTVDISGSTIRSNGKKGEIAINALNTFQEVDGGKDTWAAAEDNTLTISDTTLTDSSEADNFIELQGGNVKLTNVTTKSDGIEIAAKSGYTEYGEDTELSTSTTHNLASNGMDVSLVASNITAEDSIGVTGKTVTANGTSFDAGKSIYLAAGKDAYLKEAKQESGDSALGVTADAGDLVSVTGGSLASDGNISLYGGSVKLDSVKTVNAGGYIDLIAGKTSKYDRVYNTETKQHDDAHQLNASSANAIMVNDSTMTAGDGIVAFGGNVDVAGSTLTNTGAAGEIDLDALNTFDEVQGDNDTWKATRDNTLTVSDSTLTNNSTAEDNKAIELQGGKVTISGGTTVTSSDVYVASKSGYHDGDDTDDTNHQYASAGMNTHIQDSTLTATTGSLDVTGKTVTLDGKTALKAGHGMVIAAGSDVAVKDAPNHEGDPTITITGGTNIRRGKSVTVEGWNTFQPDVDLFDTDIVSPLVEPTNPSEPVTPDPMPAADVDANVKQGREDMNTTLAGNPSNEAAAVAQEAQKLSDADMNDTAKGAQLAGYMQAIHESDFPQAQQKELHRIVIRNVEATAAADGQAKDRQAESAEAGRSAASEPMLFDDLVSATVETEPTVTVEGEAEE